MLQQNTSRFCAAEAHASNEVSADSEVAIARVQAMQRSDKAVCQTELTVCTTGTLSVTTPDWALSWKVLSVLSSSSSSSALRLLLLLFAASLSRKAPCKTSLPHIQRKDREEEKTWGFLALIEDKPEGEVSVGLPHIHVPFSLMRHSQQS